MKQIYFIRTTEQESRRSPGGCVAGALQTLGVVELMLFSALLLLRDEFAGWLPVWDDFRKMQGILALAILLFGVVAPMLGRYRLQACAVMEIGFLLAGSRYVIARMENLQGGFLSMLGDYLVEWNAYYKTNYMLAEPGSAAPSEMVCFIMLLFLLLPLVARYVGGVRFLFPALPLFVLSLGLLVDVLPGWQGLALFLAGVILLYAGPADMHRQVFVPAREAFRVSAAWHVLALVSAGLLAALLLVTARPVFARFADHFPEKMPRYVAIQRGLEERLAGLENRVHTQGREYVDNSTPEYRNTRILQIEASHEPGTNLYLPEFASGTYQNGEWLREDEVYERTTTASGLDGDELGMLMWQTAYGNLAGGDARYACAGRSDYSITYAVGTDFALVPYASDVAQLADVWVEGEGAVKKSFLANEITFRGADANTNLWQTHGFGEERNRAWEWYASYARVYYAKPCEIAAVKAAAARVRERVQTADSSEFASAWRLRLQAAEETDKLLGKNAYRAMMADFVREELAAACEYNLYLDDIPAGTDTIQYFLETGHEGYCMHFASAGALILQELGIPARYAGGYIVKKDAFVRDLGTGAYRATVYDRNAHAWVEVYLEGIGWLPFEMTPGYERGEDGLLTDEENRQALQEKHAEKHAEAQTEADAESESETEAPAETESETEALTETEGETQSAAVAEPADGAGTPEGTAPESAHARTSPGMAKRLGVFLLAVAAAVAGLVLCIRKQRNERALARELREKRYRLAVCRMNRRIYRDLRHTALRGRCRTDAQYERRLIETYPNISADDWARYMAVVRKAAFSRETVTEEEKALCLRIYRTRQKGGKS